jgi:hypothetical protein
VIDALLGGNVALIVGRLERWLTIATLDVESDDAHVLRAARTRLSNIHREDPRHGVDAQRLSFLVDRLDLRYADEIREAEGARQQQAFDDCMGQLHDATSESVEIPVSAILRRHNGTINCRSTRCPRICRLQSCDSTSRRAENLEQLLYTLSAAPSTLWRGSLPVGALAEAQSLKRRLHRRETAQRCGEVLSVPERWRPGASRKERAIATAAFRPGAAV